jgi:23S rRNA-/tRNA-specific pseudouridylate synthase
MTEPMRIHRALARAGVASRRHAETLIAEGRVTVNGGVARLGQTVDPNRDRVQVDGKEIALEAAASKWYVLNKPAGVMTTRRDPEGRRTVFEMVPEVPGLTYVGRLDFLTEGVLLMTNDGEGANRLTHPSSEVERVYVATVRGNAKGRPIRLGKGWSSRTGWSSRRGSMCIPWKTGGGCSRSPFARGARARSVGCAPRSVWRSSAWCARSSAPCESASWSPAHGASSAHARRRCSKS